MRTEGNTVDFPHPGAVLKMFLEDMDVTQYQLGLASGMAHTRISEIIHGKRRITAETALRLGAVFGNDAETWLNLQKTWELREARKTCGEKVRSEVRKLIVA